MTQHKKTEIHNKDIEIAIVGSGPSGIAAALELKKLGLHPKIFERESEAGGTPRHCGHRSFGIFEFGKFLVGCDYANLLVKKVLDLNIDIQLNHTLIEITEDSSLKFITPEGLMTYKPHYTIIATGARECPRSTKLTGGIRSPNIMTTGTLQRFIYLNKVSPVSKIVIVGTELVSFSALFTAFHAHIKVVAMVEEKKYLNSPFFFKYFAALLGIKIFKSVNIKSINGSGGDIESVTLSNGKTLEVDGVIFSGQFMPESTVFRNYFSYNKINQSSFITPNLQTSDPKFFMVGNAVRGALAAYKCFREGKKVAKTIFENLSKKNVGVDFIKIYAEEGVQWYYPSMVDLTGNSKWLTTLRLNYSNRGVLEVKLNGEVVWERSIRAKPYKSINIPSLKQKLKLGDEICINFKSN